MQSLPINCITCSKLASTACGGQGTVQPFCESHFNQHLNIKSCNHRLLSQESITISSQDINFNLLRRNHKLDEILLSLAEPKQQLDTKLKDYLDLKNHVISEIEKVFSADAEKYVSYKQEVDKLIDTIVSYKNTPNYEVESLMSKYDAYGISGLLSYTVEISGFDLKGILHKLEEALLFQSLESLDRDSKDKLERRVQELREEFEVSSLETVSYKDDLETLTRIHQECGERIQYLEKQLVRKDQDVNFMAYEVKAREEIILKLKEDIEKIRICIRNKSQECEKYRVECKEKENKRNKIEDDCNNILQKHLKEIDALKDRIEMNTEEIKQRDRKIEELQSEYRNTLEGIKIREEQIQVLKETLKIKEDEILSQKLECSELLETVQKLTQDLQNNKSSIQNLQVSLESLYNLWAFNSYTFCTTDSNINMQVPAQGLEYTSLSQPLLSQPFYEYSQNSSTQPIFNFFQVSDSQPQISHSQSFYLNPEADSNSQSFTIHLSQISIPNSDTFSNHFLSSPETIFTLEAQLQAHYHEIKSLAISSDLEYLYACSQDSYLSKWSLTTYKYIAFIQGSSQSISSIALTHSNLILISSSSDSTIKLWNTSDLTLMNIIQGHQNHIWSVSVSPCDNFIASGSADKSVRLWNLPSGERGHVFTGHTRAVHSVVISPDSKYVISGSADSTVRIWNIDNIVEEAVLRKHETIVLCVNISRDGEFIISGGLEAVLIVWKFETRECIYMLREHSNMITCIEMMSEGYFISGSVDGMFKVWNGREGRLIKSVEGHKKGILCCAGNEEGRIVCTGGKDNFIKIWRVRDLEYY